MVTGGRLSEFQGPQGKRHLIDSLRAQRLVREEDVAQVLANCVRLEEVRYGTTIITQGSSDHDLVFILAGVFFITVGRQVVSRRTAGEHVGEIRRRSLMRKAQCRPNLTARIRRGCCCARFWF